MGEHAAEGDGRSNKRIQLLVATDSQLQVTGRNPLDLEVLSGVLAGRSSALAIVLGREGPAGLGRRAEAAVARAKRLPSIPPRGPGEEGGCRGIGRGQTHACQLENLGRQVLENRRDIDGRLRADAHLVLRVGLEEALHAAAGELDGTRHVSIVHIGSRALRAAGPQRRPRLSSGASRGITARGRTKSHPSETRPARPPPKQERQLDPAPLCINARAAPSRCRGPLFGGGGRRDDRGGRVGC